MPPTASQTPLRTVIKAHKGWQSINLKELWRYRELMWFLALRDIKIRYKQTVLGFLWAVIQPFMAMVVFTTLFTLLRTNPTTSEKPYYLVTYCAMLPWQLFTSTLSQSGNSLIGSANLIKKIYFPRLIIPAAPLLSALLDFTIASSLLIAMMAWNGIIPNWAVVTLPLWILLALLSSLSLSLWLSALNAIYRDIKYVIPFVVQLGMFVTPVIWTPDKILADYPNWIPLVYLNPMAGVIEGFRWALLGETMPDLRMVSISLGMVLLLFTGGLYYFRRMERTFADII